LAISISKALLVALFFMHMKGSSRLLHFAATAGVIWLLILFSLTLGDYFTRDRGSSQVTPSQIPEHFDGER